MMMAGTIDFWFQVCADLGYSPFKHQPDTILQQYTGLTDKGGIEIYEGDILVYKDRGSITCDFTEPVEWNEKQGYFCTESSEHVWGEVARLSKVIGNIYENQDLIK